MEGSHVMPDTSKPAKSEGKVRVPLLAVSLILLAAGCAESPITIAMHDPIYPTAREGVTFTLERVSKSKLIRVELYETVSRIDSQGRLTSSGAETLLHSWSSPDPAVEFAREKGYGANALVRYRFAVKARSGLWPRTETYSQEVSFATKPYPVGAPVQASLPINRNLAMPAPVYAVADDGFDVVLIPDLDISNADMRVFLAECRAMIRDAFLDEPTTRSLRRSLNFYINPLPGMAVGWESRPALGEHREPANRENLSFAEGRILMHKRELLDYGLVHERLCSTEMGNRGTVLHESGHSLFGLADEYEGGVQWKAVPLPNTWDSLAVARAVARARGKRPSDAWRIGPDTPWWKLCGDECQMDMTGTKHSIYDRPCHDRIVWCVRDQARQQAR